MTQLLGADTGASVEERDETPQLEAPQPGADGRALWQKRRFLLPVTALVAFMVGISVGGSGAESATQQAEAAVEQLENQVQEANARAGEAIAAREQAEGQVAQQRQELDARSAALDQREAAVAEAERTLDAASATAGSAPKDAVASAPRAAPKPGCDPSYSPCIPAYPPDLNCDDIGHPVTVTGSDPHRLDRDGDGVGCESS